MPKNMHNKKTKLMEIRFRAQKDKPKTKTTELVRSVWRLAFAATFTKYSSLLLKYAT
jgi:hypothetical protein